MSEDVEITIRNAFTDVLPPAEDELCDSVGGEAFADTQPFRGKRWQELGPDFLERYQYALFWFTPKAFHYYLPAFLLGGLARPDAVFVVTILQLLQPTADDTRARFREERWGLLSDAQVDSLEKWLCWFLDQTNPGPIFASELQQGLQVVRDRFWW